jgi:hypothetical protein
MSSVGVKFIAHEFLKAFNSQIIDGHSVRFETSLEVKDENGNIVYGNSLDRNILVENNQELMQKIIKLDNDLLDLSHSQNYNYGYFEDFYFDYGITNELIVDLWQNSPEYVHGGVSYQKTLDSYLNRPNQIQNYVISGQFSKSIIERFQRDIGKENVVVVNFLRNLSTSLALHIQDEDYFSNFKITSETDYYLRIFESTLSAIKVMSVDGVHNVRFEDFLKNNFIEIKNKKINLPKFYNNFNNLLTYWEKEKIVNTKNCTPENLNYYNDIFSNSSKAIDIFLETQKFYAKEDSIEFFVEKIKNGEQLEPLIISKFKDRYVLSDGMQRYLAYKRINAKEVLVNDGTKTFNIEMEEMNKIVEEGDEYEYDDNQKEILLKALPTNFFVALGCEPLQLASLIRRLR